MSLQAIEDQESGDLSWDTGKVQDFRDPGMNILEVCEAESPEFNDRMRMGGSVHVGM